MIVKNESAVIERCLANVRPYIDAWTILDTGSTDDTRERIAKALEGLAGELHERPWADFGHNRSELFELARKSADYQLLLDADMTLDGSPSAFADLSADGYIIAHAGEPLYWNIRLVRSALPWRYVGGTHEVIVCDEPTDQQRLYGVQVVHFADGGSRSDKYERDERILRAAVQAEHARH